MKLPSQGLSFFSDPVFRFFTNKRPSYGELLRNRSSHRISINVLLSSFHYFFLICLSKIRSFALFARGLLSLSPSDGKIGFVVTTLPMLIFPQTQTGNSGGQVQGFSFFRNADFTILSSREWNVITQILPPSSSLSIIASSAPDKTSSSRLQAMRIA